MIFSKLFRFTLAVCALSMTGKAATVFNFDGDALGTSSNFTDTQNGVAATFSSPADPGGFVVYSSIFQTLTGNVLGDPGPAGANDIALSVAFNLNLAAVTLDFATADFGSPSPFTLAAYENSTLVGQASATGSFPPGGDFPEGQISFSGKNFNQLVLSSSAPDFAIDNVSVTTAPEPAAIALLGASLLVAGVPALRRRPIS
jgi:hypothetical protein